MVVDASVRNVFRALRSRAKAAALYGEYVRLVNQAVLRPI